MYGALVGRRGLGEQWDLPLQGPLTDCSQRVNWGHSVYWVIQIPEGSSVCTSEGLHCGQLWVSCPPSWCSVLLPLEKIHGKRLTFAGRGSVIRHHGRKSIYFSGTFSERAWLPAVSKWSRANLKVGSPICPVWPSKICGPVASRFVI